jgi:Glycine transporter
MSLETRPELAPIWPNGLYPTRHARLLQIIDLAGTFVLAIQGASTAAVKGLDAFGIVVVSLATATGGASCAIFSSASRLPRRCAAGQS